MTDNGSTFNVFIFLKLLSDWKCLFMNTFFACLSKVELYRGMNIHQETQECCMDKIPTFSLLFIPACE